MHFIARGSHLQALRSDGLRVAGPEPIHIARVAATDEAERMDGWAVQKNRIQIKMTIPGTPSAQARRYFIARLQ